MVNKVVRIGDRDFDVMWADVKDGVLTFKSVDGSVWTTNQPFIVTEWNNVEGTEGRGEVGASTGKASSKRLRKARKSD